MNENLNIEDLFKNSFEGQEMQPSKGVWNGINSKLWRYQLGGFFKGKFSDYKLDPSSALWSNISRKLWWILFFRFSLTRFNIYYTGAAAVLLTVIGINVFSDQTSNQNIESVSAEKNPQTESNLIALDVDRKTDPVDDTEQSKPKAQKLSKELINFLNTKKGEASENQPSLNNKNKENKTPDKKLKANTGAPVFFRQNEEKKNIPDENKALITYNEQKQNSENPDVLNKEEIKLPLSFLKARKPLITTDPFIRQYPDTIGYSVLGSPIVFLKSAWAAELYFSPLYNQGIFKSLNSEFNNVVDYRKSLTDPAFSYSVGANLNYYWKNWLFQCGVAYTELTEKIKAQQQFKDVFSFDYYQYFNNGFFVNDTVWFLDMDSLLQNGDSIWLPGIINQTWQDHRDSTLQKGYDTITTNTYSTVKNKYSYFEIPVMVGFELRQNKFTIFGEPYFRKNLNSVFENKYYMSHKFQSAGIKFGVKYKF